MSPSAERIRILFLAHQESQASPFYHSPFLFLSTSGLGFSTSRGPRRPHTWDVGCPCSPLQKEMQGCGPTGTCGSGRPYENLGRPGASPPGIPAPQGWGPRNCSFLALSWTPMSAVFSRGPGSIVAGEQGEAKGLGVAPITRHPAKGWGLGCGEGGVTPAFQGA